MNLKRSPYHKLYLLLLFGLWFGLITQLVRQFYFNRADKTIYLSLATGLQKLPSEMEWMNIRLNGKKIGYSYSSIRNDSIQGYIVSNLIDFNTIIAGTPVQVVISSTAVVDTNFRYRSFDWKVRSGLYNTHIRGELKAGRAYVQRIESGDTTRMEYPVPQDIYPSQAVKHLLAQRGIKKGDRFILPVFEPLSREMTDLVITHEGQADLTIDSTTLKLNRIKIMYNDLPTYLWLDDNGVTFREEGMLGLVLDRTTVEGALENNANFSDFDLADFYAVPVEGVIINPRQVNELTLEIQGLPALTVDSRLTGPAGVDQSTGLVLHLSTQLQPLQDNDISPYLAPNALIQSRNIRILKMAQQLVGSVTDPQLQVKVLLDWVFGYLKKVPVANLASAVEILNQGVGDCSEHTTLFTSLSRSLGIPTRINMGLVYLDGRFLYHAWPSVLIDNHWLNVDPTFGQIPADATHLPLIEGDFTNLSELLPILGQIRIFIKDYE
ncbi:MAG: transglutaminase domain-containing protein [Candidatus Marinimicrobia bacterium]|nr:transglutaminase domain-containing protein [Candidatus Neomarinimicrobiota bacterium]